MRNTPNLGTTREEALRSAYDLGYEHFDGMEPSDFIEEREFQVDLETAVEELGLHHFEEVRIAVSESQANKRLWRALEDFYEEHLPDQYDRFKREAAVAEDYDTAFDAGAFAAIRGDDPDPDEHLSIFLD